MGTVHEWAERLVVGTRLEDKLAPPPLEDPRRQALVVPRWPGRPASLALPAGRTAPPPRPDELHRDGVAVHALHTFVNHELQALELMAAALLRFPELPAALRRGLVATIVDEQRHLSRYHGRLSALGGELGRFPVSAYFWEALREAPGPAAFVAGMSLGFEQANLDFARTWRQAFAREGDTETARVLDEVYADEIRHVSLGRVWFDRWRDPALSLFEAWRRALVAPLTPERARGPVLDRDGRRAAGLPDAYVRELAVTRASRGRLPTVWWFTPWVEDDLAGRGGLTTLSGLSWLPAMAAAAGDVIVAPRPELSFLEAWERAGLDVPEVVPDLAALQGRALGRVEPWGHSPAVETALDQIGHGRPGAVACARTLSAREWAVTRRRELGVEAGEVCTTEAEVDRAAVAASGPWVAKADLSASGRHRIRGEGPITDRDRRWLAHALRRGPVVVERWLDGCVDLSVQIHIDDDGPRVVGLTRFEARLGVFRGVWLGDWQRGLPADVLRFAHGDGRRAGWLEARLREVALHVGRAAAEHGHRGPLGVDALVHRGRDGLQLQPLIEVNPRWTVGRLALASRARLAPGTSAWWRFVSARSLPTTPAEWVARAMRLQPVSTEAGRLVEGCVATHDPATAGPIVTLLVAGRTAAEAERRWAALRPR